MDADPDLQWVKRCQSGDVSAFDNLVLRHKDRIYRLIYRMLNDRSEVDDVAQEVFLKAYRGIRRFRYRSSFSTWLTRIAVNYCISYLRNQWRLRLFPVNMLSQEDQRPLPAEPQTAVEHTEKFRKVYQSINSLPPKQRAVIILRYFEEHSCEEMAEILDCSVGTIKSRLFHARKKLRKRLEPYLRSGEWTKTNSEIGGEGYEMFKM